MENQVDFGKKHTEQELSSIGAKVADATDYTHEIERLSELAEDKLEAAQEQLGDLYENLGETPVKVAEKPAGADAKPAQKDEKKVSGGQP